MYPHQIMTGLTLAGWALLTAACSDWPLTSGGGEAHGELAVTPSNPIRHTSAPVQTHPSQGPVVLVPGAEATSVTSETGARVTLRTRDLDPGHAVTMWWVVVNAPENCSTSPCSAGDILFASEAVKSNVAYAAGHVVEAGGRASGRATFAAHFSTGPVPGGWFDHEFINPGGAEIHLILMDHGPAIPDLLRSQISSLRGGCTDQSVPAAFPPVAHADGIPGPNTCRLVQFAVLQP
jgi:hypothetical protein